MPGVSSRSRSLRSPARPCRSPEPAVHDRVSARRAPTGRARTKRRVSMAGSMVEFTSNGSKTAGYLATPAAGKGPGVLVLQEWWGLVGHIKEVCDRFAGEGFTALAPDLYHGVKAKEPDEAAKLMMALDLEGAARDMAGAVDFLAGHEAVRGRGVGVVGFCMGGGLALWLATLRPDQVRAVVT